MLWDSDTPGLVVRRQKSATITFSVIYRTKEGVQRWQKLGHLGNWTLEQARTKASKIRRAADNGEDPAQEKYDARNSPTVAELLDLYVADMQSARHNGKKLSTQSSDLSRVKTHIRPKLGKSKVSAVTTAQIESFMNRCSPGSAKRILQLTSAIFTYAQKKKMRSDNPCRGITKPADVRKTRRLSEAEYAQLGKALEGDPSPVGEVFLALALSGWRSSEMRLLKRSEVDLERGCATLSDTKTGKSVRPLSGALIAIIQRQDSAAGEFVFPLKTNSIHHHWERLQIPKEVTMHTLRHSFASLAADMGYSDHVISGLLGHRQQSITSRYLHIDKTLVEAADKVAQQTLQLMRA